MNKSFHFEICAKPASSAINFFGIFENGRKVTVVTRHQNIAYTYELPENEAITPERYFDILDGSLGQYWTGELKKIGKVVEKVDADFWKMTHNHYFNGTNKEEILSHYNNVEPIKYTFNTYSIFASF